MSQIKNRPLEFHANREDLLEHAFAEQDGCISVGGLAQEMGMLRRTAITEPRVFGRFIEFARRARNWSPERLAEAAQVELGELVNIESLVDCVPRAATVQRLAETLGYSYERLAELAGLQVDRDPKVREAAIRFAARLEPVSKLNEEQLAALDQLGKVLVEKS